MKFYTHKTTSISVIETSTPSFIRTSYSVYEIFNSFKLLSQTSVTDIASLSYSLWWLLLTAGQCPSPPTMHVRRLRYCQLRHPTSLHHQPTGLATEQSRSNLVDYAIWGILQERVYRCRIRDINHLKEQLIEEWRRFDQNIIDRAVNQCRDRLHKCVRANMGHFERLI